MCQILGSSIIRDFRRSEFEEGDDTQSHDLAAVVDGSWFVRRGTTPLIEEGIIA
jgi:hypothetical protein